MELVHTAVRKEHHLAGILVGREPYCILWVFVHQPANLGRVCVDAWILGDAVHQDQVFPCESENCGIYLLLIQAANRQNHGPERRPTVVNLHQQRHIQSAGGSYLENIVFMLCYMPDALLVEWGACGLEAVLLCMAFQSKPVTQRQVCFDEPLDVFVLLVCIRMDVGIQIPVLELECILELLVSVCNCSEIFNNALPMLDGAAVVVRHLEYYQHDTSRICLTMFAAQPRWHASNP